MALTKADLTKKLIQGLGINKPDAKGLVDQFFAEIKASLERGQAVKLSGFGNYELREKKERPGRNPKTGEAMAVTARRVVTFRPGQKLKTRVEQVRGQRGAGQEGVRLRYPVTEGEQSL